LTSLSCTPRRTLRYLGQEDLDMAHRPTQSDPDPTTADVVPAVLQIAHVKEWMNTLRVKFDVHMSLQSSLDAVTSCTKKQVLEARQIKDSTASSQAQEELSQEHELVGLQKFLAAFGNIKKMDELNDTVVLTIADGIAISMTRLHKFERDVNENVRNIQSGIHVKEEEMDFVYKEQQTAEEQYAVLCAQIDQMSSASSSSEAPGEASIVPVVLLQQFKDLEHSMAANIRHINTLRRAFRADASEWLSQLKEVEKFRNELQWDFLSLVGLSLDNIISRRCELVARCVMDIAELTGDNVVAGIRIVVTEEDVNNVTHETCESVYGRLLGDISQAVETVSAFSRQINLTSDLLSEISKCNRENGCLIRDILDEHGFAGSSDAGGTSALPPFDTRASDARHNKTKNLYDYESRSVADAWLSLFQTLSFFADPEETVLSRAPSIDKDIHSGRASPYAGAEIGILMDDTVIDESVGDVTKKSSSWRTIPRTSKQPATEAKHEERSAGSFGSMDCPDAEMKDSDKQIQNDADLKKPQPHQEPTGRDRGRGRAPSNPEIDVPSSRSNNPTPVNMVEAAMTSPKMRTNEMYVNRLTALNSKLRAMKVSILAPQQQHTEAVERHKAKMSAWGTKISNLESEIDERHDMLEELEESDLPKANRDSASIIGFENMSQQDKTEFVSQTKSKISALKREILDIQGRRDAAETIHLEETLPGAVAALWSVLRSFRESFATHIESSLEIVLDIFGQQRKELAVLQQGLSALRVDVGGQDVEKYVEKYLRFIEKKQITAEIAVNPLVAQLTSTPWVLILHHSAAVQALRMSGKLHLRDVILKEAELEDTFATEGESADTKDDSHDNLNSLTRGKEGPIDDCGGYYDHVPGSLELRLFPSLSGDRERTFSNDSELGSGSHPPPPKVDASRIAGIGSAPDDTFYDVKSGKYVTNVDKSKKAEKANKNKNGAIPASDEQEERKHALGFFSRISVPAKPSFNPKEDPALMKELKLPDSERIIDWFNCCIFPQPWILVQGTCYITQKYLAFRGWPETTCKRLLPLKDISHILKANTAVIIPNALRVVMLSGVEHFFASFIDRDPCFKLLTTFIEAEKQFEALRVADSLRKAGDGLESLEKAKRARAEAAKLLDEEEKKKEREAQVQREAELLAEREKKMMEEAEQKAELLATAEKSAGAAGGGDEASGAAAALTAIPVPYIAPADTGVSFENLLQRAVATTLVDEVIAVTPRNLWERYWKDQTGHTSFLRAEGDVDISGGNWTTLGIAGQTFPQDAASVPFQATRNLKYKHPREGLFVIGPKSALADLQQYAYLSGEGSQPFLDALHKNQDTNAPTTAAANTEHPAVHKPFRGLVMCVLSFEGIPMSQSFKVVQYWLFEPSVEHPASHCRVRIGYCIFYVKSCMFASSIDKGTKGELEPLSRRWCSWVEQYVQENLVKNNPAAGVATASNLALTGLMTPSSPVNNSAAPARPAGSGSGFVSTGPHDFSTLLQCLMSSPMLAMLFLLLLSIIFMQWYFARSLHTMLQAQQEHISQLISMVAGGKVGGGCKAQEGSGQ